MLRSFLGLAIALICAAATALPAEWTPQKPSPLAGAPDIEHSAWTAPRPPNGPFDRIEVHRYRTKTTPWAAMLYLPGTNMNGEAALSSEDHNLWVFLARRGVEVFTLDYRTRFSSSVTDPKTLTSMKDWTTEAFVEDIKAASALTRAESGRAQLYLAGFSRGVFLAYAYACAEPAAVAGLIALDGQFKSHAPKGQYTMEAELKKIEESGAWANDVSGRLGWEGRQKLMLAAAENPNGPATDPKFKTIGEQLSNLLHFAWGPGALASPLGGQSKPDVLGRLMAGYDRFYPAIQDIDARRMADRDDDPLTSLDDLWGEMKTPILYFGNARMAGDWLLNGIYSAQKSGSPDVSIHVLEGYGHLDVLVSEHARREVFEPTLAWIKSRASRP